jgi:Beta-L-arabinofuranosidase, GH127
MLMIIGEAKYADLMERILYNGFLAGLSLDGQRYIYANPLQVREGHIARGTVLHLGKPGARRDANLGAHRLNISRRVAKRRTPVRGTAGEVLETPRRSATSAHPVRPGSE